jgi:hypothetical protein
LIEHDNFSQATLHEMAPTVQLTGNRVAVQRGEPLADQRIELCITAPPLCCGALLKPKSQ